jgi:hypothetical protein
MLKTGRMIAVERAPERPEVAQEHYKPEIVNFGFLDNPQARIGSVARGFPYSHNPVEKQAIVDILTAVVNNGSENRRRPWWYRQPARSGSATRRSRPMQTMVRLLIEFERILVENGVLTSDFVLCVCRKK